MNEFLDQLQVTPVELDPSMFIPSPEEQIRAEQRKRLGLGDPPTFIHRS